MLHNRRNGIGRALIIAAIVGVVLQGGTASADIGDPCDVQAGASGAGLYIRTQVFVTTLMTRNSSLNAFGCATRTAVAPDVGQWNPLIPFGVQWVKAANGTQMTFYETAVPVLGPGGIATGDHYWVASTEVTLDEP